MINFTNEERKELAQLYNILLLNPWKEFNISTDMLKGLILDFINSENDSKNRIEQLKDIIKKSDELISFQSKRIEELNKIIEDTFNTVSWENLF